MFTTVTSAASAGANACSRARGATTFVRSVRSSTSGSFVRSWFLLGLELMNKLALVLYADAPNEDPTDLADPVEQVPGAAHPGDLETHGGQRVFDPPQRGLHRLGVRAGQTLAEQRQD